MTNINKSLLAVLMISLFSLATLASVSSLVQKSQSVLGENTDNPIGQIPCQEILRLKDQFCSSQPIPPTSTPIITYTPVKPTSVVIPTSSSIRVTPTLSTSSNASCNIFYWFDNTTKNCTIKTFCGNYMYSGLRTFKSQQDCLNALKL